MSSRWRSGRGSQGDFENLKQWRDELVMTSIASYHFVTGALMNTLGRTGRIDRLSGGVCHSDDFPAIKEAHGEFMAAGFKAIKNT